MDCEHFKTSSDLYTLFRLDSLEDATSDGHKVKLQLWIVGRSDAWIFLSREHSQNPAYHIGTSRLKLTQMQIMCPGVICFRQKHFIFRLTKVSVVYVFVQYRILSKMHERMYHYDHRRIIDVLKAPMRSPAITIYATKFGRDTVGCFNFAINIDLQLCPQFLSGILHIDIVQCSSLMTLERTANSILNYSDREIQLYPNFDP